MSETDEIEQPKPSEISQDTFLRFLKGERVLEGGPEEFPHLLDLGMFENDIRGLRTIAEGVQGEVARTVFIDPLTGTIRAKDHTDFDEASVTPIALGEGEKPLLELHTHPIASNPSINDYAKLFIGVPELQRRIQQAILVVCPDTQILALPTNNTPILDPADAIALIQKWDQKGRDTLDEQIGPDRKRLDSVVKATLASQAKLLTAHSQKTLDALRDQDTTALHVVSEELRTNSEKLRERADRLSGTVSRRLMGSAEASIGAHQAEFVQAMGIKLYSSVDSRHFGSVSP